MKFYIMPLPWLSYLYWLIHFNGKFHFLCSEWCVGEVRYFVQIIRSFLVLRYAILWACRVFFLSPLVRNFPHLSHLLCNRQCNFFIFRGPIIYGIAWTDPNPNILSRSSHFDPAPFREATTLVRGLSPTTYA